MKITIIGAAGVRTPLIVQAIHRRQKRLGLTELSLMDIDEEHLELIGALTQSIERSPTTQFQITRTIDPQKALLNADYVISTFRVGGSESRVIDELVPLRYGILGQETTGPGGFAMGVRSIPVILGYVKLMQKFCPQAWLINFANPSGMLTEAVVRNSAWHRIVGICDTPSSMHQILSTLLDAEPADVYPDYFGLNHLGWFRRVIHHHQDKLDQIITSIESGARMSGLSFNRDMISHCKMIPIEYLYYYYSTTQAVNNILASNETRGEQISRQNAKLFADLSEKFRAQDLDGMQASYQAYLDERGSTYMTKETGITEAEKEANFKPNSAVLDEGYAGVALNLIEALSGHQPRMQILNIPNEGAIYGMEAMDVVEIPAFVSHDNLRPMAVGEIPAHCMSLIKRVKQYEHLTIEAAVEGSYPKAQLALASHPLVHDHTVAGAILNEYIREHQGYFPALV